MLLKQPKSIHHQDKGALTEHHAMKAYWGSGGTAPLIL
jgi:hypothetical protein